MKCESCGNELTGGAIICRVCNHNNAVRGDWRTKRLGQQTAPRRPGETQPNPSRTTGPLTELPRIVPRKDADANLVRFPLASNKQEDKRTEASRPAPRSQAAAAPETGAAPYPPWRAELKERVRQIREKRNTGELAAPSLAPAQPAEMDFDRNPIVESALNRIRWSSHAPAITATVGASTQGARAAAAAKLTQPKTAPAPPPELRPLPRPTHRPEARVETRIASPRPNHPGQLTISREVSRTGNQPAATRPIVNQVETKTLTPKTHREASLRPEPNPAPAPASRILTPRAKPSAAEPKAEPHYERRGPEATPQSARPAASRPFTSRPATGAPDKHVETQVIEIAQAPEPLPFPEAEPASLWARTMAGACDFEIIATAYLPLFGAYAVLNDSSGAASSFINESSFIMTLLLSAIVFIYQMVMLTFAGRTFGMALLNLNLVNTDDESMSVTRRQKILRALAATAVFVCFPLYLVTRLSLYRRSLPDLISGTTVAGE